MEEKKQTLQSVTLKDIAKEVLLAAKGDRAKAETEIRKRLKKLPQLRDQILSDAIHDVIREAAHQLRHNIWRTKNGAAKIDGLIALAQSNEHDILNEWPLKSAPKMIGDATSKELMDEYDYYHSQVTFYSMRRHFIRLVLDAMGDRQFVRDALSNQKLAELIKTAKEETELE